MPVIPDDDRSYELVQYIIEHWPHTGTSEEERDHLLMCLAMNAGCVLAPLHLEQGDEGTRPEIEEFVGILIDTMKRCAKDMKQ